MLSRKRRRTFRILLGITGLVAILLAILDLLPALFVLLTFLYCFALPAWIIRKKFASFFPDASEFLVALAILPILIPVWIALISLLWIPFQGLYSAQAIAIVAIMIVAVTTLSLVSPGRFFQMEGAQGSSTSVWLLLGAGAFLGIVIAVMDAAVFASPALAPNAAYPGTEFYLLQDSNGLLITAPSDPKDAGSLQVGIHITNHEGQPGVYRIIVMGENERALAEAGPILLENGAVWEGFVEFQPASGNNQKIVLFLERMGYPWPYQTLYFWLGNT
jgi:hypothetical protein